MLHDRLLLDIAASRNPLERSSGSRDDTPPRLLHANARREAIINLRPRRDAFGQTVCRRCIRTQGAAALIGTIEVHIERTRRFRTMPFRRWSACTVCPNAFDDAPELRRKNCADQTQPCGPALRARQFVTASGSRA